MYIGTDRRLLTRHDAIILRQIARGLLHALSHIGMIPHSTAVAEPIGETGWNMSVCICVCVFVCVRVLLLITPINNDKCTNADTL